MKSRIFTDALSMRRILVMICLIALLMVALAITAAAHRARARTSSPFRSSV